MAELLPGQIVSRLLPLVDKCKAVEADSLKSSKMHLVKQMSSLKTEFDSGFESLWDKLNSLTGDVLMKALGDNPQKKDHDRLNRYWMAIQLKIADKIRNLTSFQNNLNSRCHKIYQRQGTADLLQTHSLFHKRDRNPGLAKCRTQ